MLVLLYLHDDKGVYQVRQFNTIIASELIVFLLPYYVNAVFTIELNQGKDEGLLLVVKKLLKLRSTIVKKRTKGVEAKKHLNLTDLKKMLFLEIEVSI